jgi:WD40 repeat protein
VWDAQTGARLYRLHEPSAGVYALTWSLGGGGLVSGGSDGRLYWWDLHHGESVRVCKAHEETVQALKVSPDGRRLASCGDDGAIKFWGLESGEHLHTLRRDRPYERLNITCTRGLTEAEIATLRALGPWRTAWLLYREEQL